MLPNGLKYLSQNGSSVNVTVSFPSYTICIAKKVVSELLTMVVRKLLLCSE
jgi:hypothetical protein